MPSNILVALSGSISAYKVADVVSELTRQGHSVQCLATASALQFVTPLVLETLSGRPVKSALFGTDVSGTEHIELARWADLMVVVPASANIIAKLALGLADDLITTVALATDAPMIIAPAMNTVMWTKPVVQQHVAALSDRRVNCIAPSSGILACGEVGEGRLAPVNVIVEAINDALSSASMDLMGKRVLITAGPTTSPIDAVRYITNHSTGRMGAALAEEALRRGAEVRYVLGVDKGVVLPTSPRYRPDRLTVVEVRTAEEMATAALKFLPEVDGVIATAAVLDYRVATPSANKLKRSVTAAQLELVPSIDVLKVLKQAASSQWFLGFAAETDDVTANGLAKLHNKDLDFLFANAVARTGETSTTGFSVPTNGGVLLSRHAEPVPLPVMTKTQLARRIWDLII